MIKATLLVCELFGALVLAVDAAPYFRWGDAGQHVEVWIIIIIQHLFLRHVSDPSGHSEANYSI